MPSQRNTANLARVIPPALLIAALLALWQVGAPALGLDAATLPTPTQIVASGWADRADLAVAAAYSAAEVAAGMALAVAFGVGLGAVTAQATVARSTLLPLVVAAQTVPIIAIAPLVVRWAGFGIGGKIVLVGIYATLPILLATYRGMRDADPSQVATAASLGANSTWIAAHVKLPSAARSVFAGVKISATYAFGTAATAEYVGAENGLGTYLNVAKNSYRTDLVFAATLALVALTLLLFALVWATERALIRWPEGGTR